MRMVLGCARSVAAAIAHPASAAAVATLSRPPALVSTVAVCDPTVSLYIINLGMLLECNMQHTILKY
jgi:hypothetical protein